MEDTVNSLSNLVSQESSAQTLLIDLYSASAEESAIVVYFLDFQDMGESPNITKNPLTRCLV